MITPDKNCFRSQDGAVIETAGKSSTGPSSSVVNYTDMPPASVASPGKSKIKTPPSNTFNKFYFFD